MAKKKSKTEAVNMGQVEILAKKGFTDKEMSEFFDMSLSTWNLWKRDDLQFREDLSVWKSVADNNVQKSLYQRANGYDCKETKVFYNSKEDIVRTVDIIKHYPPDATSMIFWLKNRQPEKFKDTIRNEHDVTGTLAEALKEARERRIEAKEEKTKIKDVTPIKELSGEEDFLE